MYSEDVVFEKVGFKDGERKQVLISEADSVFPGSLLNYEEVINAYIVGEDEITSDGRQRPEKLEIEVSRGEKAFIHLPYKLELSGNNDMIIHNPPRFLKIELKDGISHYIPFGGENGTDEKTDYEEEWLELFDDSHEEIRVLREAGKTLAILTSIEEDIENLPFDFDEVQVKIRGLSENYPIRHLSDYFRNAEESDNRFGDFIDTIRTTTEANKEIIGHWIKRYDELESNVDEGQQSEDKVGADEEDDRIPF